MILYQRKVYVDIAAVFDLRQGVLSVIDEDFSVAVTTNASYYLRDEDVFSAPVFGQLDRKLYDQVTSTYSQEVLRSAVTTKIFKFIKHLYARYTLSNARSSVEMKVELEINTWPYVLASQEMLDMHDLIDRMFGSKIPVRIACFDPNLLVPEKLEETYLAMIFYDCSSWVNSYQSRYEKKKKFTNVPIFVPRKWHSPKPSASELKQMTDKGVDPIQLYERILAPIIPINFIPMSFFCVNLPANLDEYTELISR